MDPQLGRHLLGPQVLDELAELFDLLIGFFKLLRLLPEIVFPLFEFVACILPLQLEVCVLPSDRMLEHESLVL